MCTQIHKLKRKPVFTEEFLDAEHGGMMYVLLKILSMTNSWPSITLSFSKGQTVHVSLITYCYILCHT